jgi:hypothetical protein
MQTITNLNNASKASARSLWIRTHSKTTFQNPPQKETPKRTNESSNSCQHPPPAKVFIENIAHLWNIHLELIPTWYFLFPFLGACFDIAYYARGR